MKSVKITLTLLFAAILTAGCATIINGKTQELTFNSTPSGTAVYINGQQVGVTPVTVKRERSGDPITVEFRKEGYETHTATLNSEMSSAFWGNIIIGGFLGSTTDAATGAMYEFAPGQYQAVLSPKGEENAEAFQKKLELMQFVMMSYSQLSLELEKGEGEYLDTLLAKLNVLEDSRLGAIEKLRNIKASSQSIPSFADEVIAQFQAS